MNIDTTIFYVGQIITLFLSLFVTVGIVYATVMLFRRISGI